MRCGLIAVAVVLGGLRVLAAPEPEWRLPGYVYRAVFPMPEAGSRHLLVNVPLDRKAVAGTSFPAFDSRGTPVASRLVQADVNLASVLVEVDPARDEGPLVVYYGLKPGTPPSAMAAPAADPAPVRTEVFMVPGRGVPNAWDKLLYLKSAAGRPAKTEWIESFEEIDPPQYRPTGRRRQPRSGLWVAAMTSYVNCPKEGVYRFAINCRDCGFVFVDGDLRVAWPGEHAPGGWQRGPPSLLKAGPHAIEVFLASAAENGDVRVGWVPPGREEPALIKPADLLASAEAADIRVERVDRPLHPAAVLALDAAYRFRGLPPVFVPVTFTNTTRDWVTADLRCRWSFGDGSTAEGDQVRHTYAAARTYRATLEVRDDLGFVGSCTRDVDCRRVQPKEYAATFRVTGIPAVCYSRTKVRPTLLLQGTLPPWLELEEAWELTESSGATRAGRGRLDGLAGDERIPLPEAAAGTLSRLRWHIRHAGVELDGGTVDWLRPPFRTRPARVAGDRLYDAAGTQLVLVPTEGSDGYRQPPITGEQALGRLVCVDDLLSGAALLEASPGPTFDQILARLVQRPGHPGVRLVSLPPWESHPGAYGPLLELVDVPSVLEQPADVVVLSVGLRDMLELKDVEVFERHVAALSDLISATLHVPVIWVTPPPFPPDPDSVRPYAAAIRTVADARGIPVADLFTAFLCASDDWHSLFKADQMGLSDVGHRLAGHQVARALLGDEARQH